MGSPHSHVCIKDAFPAQSDLLLIQAEGHLRALCRKALRCPPDAARTPGRRSGLDWPSTCRTCKAFPPGPSSRLHPQSKGAVSQLQGPLTFELSPFPISGPARAFHDLAPSLHAGPDGRRPARRGTFTDGSPHPPVLPAADRGHLGAREPQRRQTQTQRPRPNPEEAAAGPTLASKPPLTLTGTPQRGSCWATSRPARRRGAVPRC